MHGFSWLSKHEHVRVISHAAENIATLKFCSKAGVFNTFLFLRCLTRVHLLVQKGYIVIFGEGNKKIKLGNKLAESMIVMSNRR